MSRTPVPVPMNRAGDDGTASSAELSDDEGRVETADLLTERVCVINGASYAQYGSGTLDSSIVESIPPDEQASVAIAHNAGGLAVLAGLLPAEVSLRLRPIEHLNPRQRFRIEQRRLFKQRRAIKARSCEPVISHQQSARSTTSVVENA